MRADLGPAFRLGQGSEGQSLSSAHPPRRQVTVPEKSVAALAGTSVLQPPSKLSTERPVGVEEWRVASVFEVTLGDLFRS